MTNFCLGPKSWIGHWDPHFTLRSKILVFGSTFLQVLLILGTNWNWVKKSLCHILSSLRNHFSETVKKNTAVPGKGPNLWQAQLYYWPSNGHWSLACPRQIRPYGIFVLDQHCIGLVDHFSALITKAMFLKVTVYREKKRKFSLIHKLATRWRSVSKNLLCLLFCPERGC